MKSKPLQIALVSEHASPLALAGGVDSGGQNVYVAHVARELAAAGHRVDVLTRRDDAQAPAVVELAHGVCVRHVDAGPARFVAKEDLLPYMREFSHSARQWLLRRPPLDVIHANFFMSGWVGLELRRQFAVPLVTTFHALGLVRREHQREADRFPAERIGIERTLVRDSDRVIAACPQDSADLRRLYGAAPERIASVPCGVDADALRPGDRCDARRRLGLPLHEFIVLQLGRLVPRKGIDNVVHAMAVLRQADPALPARLVVVGGDADTPDEALTPEIGRLRGIARDLGVADRVQFTGRRSRDQLRDWYVAADVFVTTPWYEPFGITPLEAMACGTPVIGSAVGGVRHTVLDGITGFLVPPREPHVLADRLLQLQRDPARAAALGRAGVQRVRAHFTWHEVARQLVQVYRSACDRARLQAPRAGRVAEAATAANDSALGLVSAS